MPDRRILPPVECDDGIRCCEDGLFDILSVTALFNFMNRILEGAGIKRHVRTLDITDEMRRSYRYTDLWKAVSRGTQA